MFTEEEKVMARSIAIAREAVNAGRPDSSDYQGRKMTYSSMEAGYRGVVAEIAASKVLREMFGNNVTLPDLFIPPTEDGYNQKGDLLLFDRVVEVRAGDQPGRIAIKQKDYRVNALMLSVWVPMDNGPVFDEVEVIGWCEARKRYKGKGDYHYACLLEDLESLPGVFANVQAA